MRAERTILLVLAWALAAALGAACAGGLRPGDADYAYNATGVYTGRLMVEGQPFEARLDLRTARGGSVRGSFSVAAPFELDGRVTGAVVDDLLRVTLAYEASDGAPCNGRIEGILTIERGGAIIDGPVTITDCEGALAGRASFRR
jgi:hypothetical protein